MIIKRPLQWSINFLCYYLIVGVVSLVLAAGGGILQILLFPGLKISAIIFNFFPSEVAKCNGNIGVGIKDCQTIASYITAIVLNLVIVFGVGYIVGIIIDNVKRKNQFKSGI